MPEDECLRYPSLISDLQILQKHTDNNRDMGRSEINLLYNLTGCNAGSGAGATASGE
jgi:hypothetical protein